MTPPDDGTDDRAPPADADRDELLRELHEHLRATAELPVERDAGRWLGEAEAVASDVADGDAPPAAIETRLDQVRELLAHVEGTGSAEADDHVAASRDVLDALDGDG